jgi:hypothetical protein
MTTKQDIKEWLDEAKAKNATHMLVVCDTFDYEDYPVYVLSGQDVNKQILFYSKDMQKVMEVYNLNMNIDYQLNEQRSYNIETVSITKNTSSIEKPLRGQLKKALVLDDHQESLSQEVEILKKELAKAKEDIAQLQREKIK